jgi:hypothetical protein
LGDFFFAPDEFVRNLNAVLDSYVNYTKRRAPAVGPELNLPTHRTPSVVLREIEQALSSPASGPENADATISLADRLWDEGWRETRLLAAFLIGRIPPEEGPLLARLTAWTSQVRDVDLRSELLNTSLGRMRKEVPEMFLQLVGEWLRPERSRFWSNAVQACLSAISDPAFTNFPRLLDLLEPVVRAAPSQLQLDLEQLLLALHRAYPTETSYFIRQVLTTSDNPMTAITLRRMAPDLPSELREEIKELIQGKPFPQP